MRNTSKISINELLKNPLDNTNACYDFYDWFCSEKGLKNRFNTLIPKLKFLVKQGIVNGDTNYVWFKNNCPMSGTLYDDIRISTLDEKNDFLGGFCPSSGFASDIDNNQTCNLWLLNNGKIEQLHFKDWKTFKQTIKNDTMLRKRIGVHFSK